MSDLDTSTTGDISSRAAEEGKEARPLLARKSVLMGVAASVGAVLAAQPGSAFAAGTTKPLAATQPYLLRWAPATAYARGAQAASPNNDLVSAVVAHTSSAAFVTDVAKWTLSSTFVQLGAFPLGSAENPVTDAAAVRPTGLPCVHWVTTTAPVNALAGDVARSRATISDWPAIVVPPPVVPPPVVPGVTQLNYQTNDFSQWQEQQYVRAAQLSIVTTPARAGYPYTAKFTCAPGDYTNGGTSAERGEVMASVANSGGTYEGQTRWYAWSAWYPVGMNVSPGGWLAHTQWHGYGPVGNGSNPNIGFFLSKTTPMQTIVSTVGGNNQRTETWLGALPLGQWVDFMVGIVWSAGSAGRMAIRQNGVTVMNNLATPNMFNGPEPTYLKQGIYRMSSPQTQTIYYAGTRHGPTEASVAF